MLGIEAEKDEKLEDRHQKSFADPQAQMLQTEGTQQFCYNAQGAGSRDGLIVGAQVTRSATDVAQLAPITEAVEKTTGEKPDLMVADRGYLAERALEQMRSRGQACLVAIERE